MPNPTCVWCGHPKEAHVGTHRPPVLPEKVEPGALKALSECPGFDSGDKDFDRATDVATDVSAEQAYLDELRPLPKRGHWE